MTDANGKSGAGAATGKKAVIWVESSNFVANSAIIASHAVSAPFSPYVIVPRDAVGASQTDDPAKVTGAIPVSTKFNLVFLTVTALTLMLAATEVLLAIAWPETTQNQQSVFEAIGTTWRAGFGALLGLLGGKQLG